MKNKKGKKNNREIGTPTKILFAKVIVLFISLYSVYEKKIVIKLTRGSETMNPAKTGFLNDNQLAKENDQCR